MRKNHSTKPVIDAQFKQSFEKTFQQFLKGNTSFKIYRNESGTFHALVQNYEQGPLLYFINDPEFHELLITDFIKTHPNFSTNTKEIKALLSDQLITSFAHYDVRSFSPKIASSHPKELFIKMTEQMSIEITPETIKMSEGYSQKEFFIKSDARVNLPHKLIDLLHWTYNHGFYSHYQNKHPSALTQEECDKIFQECHSKYESLSSTFFEIFKRFHLSENRFLIMTTWMVNTLLPFTNQLVLEITGPSYSGKSSFQKLLKQILDPRSLDNLDLPSTKKSLANLSYNHHLLSFDEISKITNIVQSEIRRLLEGTYVDLSHTLKKSNRSLKLKRPVIWNSIYPIDTEKKLQNSTLSIELPDNRFDTLSSSHVPIDPEFRYATSLHLFLLIETVLKEWDSIIEAKEIIIPPDMKDFFRVGYIISNHHFNDKNSQNENEFEKQFKLFLSERAEQIIRNTVVGDALLNYCESFENDQITFKVIGWHDILKEYRADGTSWPNNVKATSVQLEEINPWLEYLGIDFFRSDEKGEPSKNHSKQQSNYYRTLSISQKKTK